MTRTNRKRLLALAFLVWICYTIIFSVIKVPEAKVIGRFHLDIVFHFTSYLVMVVLGASLIRWWALVPALILGGGTELVQHFLPWRTASWSDFGVDAAGIALGALVFGLAAARRRKLGADRRAGT